MGYTHPTLVQVRLLAGAVYGVGAVHPARFSRKGYLGEGAHRFRKDGGVRHSHDPEDPHASANSQGVKAVVLVPSKELCMQTYNCFKSLTRFCSNEVNCIALYDNNVEQQVVKCDGADR